MKKKRSVYCLQAVEGMNNSDDRYMDESKKYSFFEGFFNTHVKFEVEREGWRNTCQADISQHF